MSTNINLLVRTDKETARHKKRVRLFNFAAIVSLIVVGLVYFGIAVLIQVVNPGSIEKEHQDLLGKMAKLQNREKTLFTLNNRIENIEKIMKASDTISTKANSLFAKIPNQLSLDNFELDNKSVIIVGQSNSLSAIGEFISNLTDMARKKEVIKSLTLNSLNLDADKNIYNISVRSEF